MVYFCMKPLLWGFIFSMSERCDNIMAHQKAGRADISCPPGWYKGFRVENSQCNTDCPRLSGTFTLKGVASDFKSSAEKAGEQAAWEIVQAGIDRAQHRPVRRRLD